MSQTKKVKILLVGPVQGHFQVLIDKLNSLQSGKAGPFDLCFCVGPFFADNEDQVKNDCNDGTLEFPLPVYVQHYSGTKKKKLFATFNFIN